MNISEDSGCADILHKLEEQLQDWIRRTEDPFDTGVRLPDTNMLDLGQQLTSAGQFAALPLAYRAAIERYQLPEILR